MRYDFTRLSPEQFEEMAVSLYAKVLGFETKIYGAGPDGQRELTGLLLTRREMNTPA